MSTPTSDKTAHVLSSASSQFQPAARLSPETIARLHTVPILASLSDEMMHCLDGARERQMHPGEVLAQQGKTTRNLWILLEGSVRISYRDGSGRDQTEHILKAGASIGEVTLLAGVPAPTTLSAASECELLELDEEHFWTLMTACPEVRKAILGNMAMRLSKIQSTTFQQEKMAALGTLAAGLMHELNNPGAAARRAASTLREKMARLHSLSARLSRTELTHEQKDRLFELQKYALTSRLTQALSTIEQTDAEDALAEWMETAHVSDSWKLAPTFISIGMDVEELRCARESFSAEILSDALNWLDALVSSQQLVGIIEESIGRVTDLVDAVKSYAYEGRGQRQDIDLNESIHGTMVMLGHKLRERQIALEKSFDPALPHLATECQGLNQVWTNLLDNAIDAAGERGRIRVETWSETVALNSVQDGKTRRDLCVLIGNSGPGIPPETQPNIFDPFFTTKSVGAGTGLGLGIVYRIVEQCGGNIRFSSEPGNTEFVVRLPANPAG